MFYDDFCDNWKPTKPLSKCNATNPPLANFNSTFTYAKDNTKKGVTDLQ